LFPTALADQRASRRVGLAGLPYIDAIPDAGDPPAFVVDPPAQIATPLDADGWTIEEQFPIFGADLNEAALRWPNLIPRDSKFAIA
jgi:hypothetical protein